MTVGCWYPWGVGEGDWQPPPSNTGAAWCGGVLQPASAMRGDGGPGSGDDVLVSAADSPANTRCTLKQLPNVDEIEKELQFFGNDK